MTSAAGAAAMERVATMIVDDEPLSLARLRGLLGEVEWVDIIGEASDGLEAVQQIDLLKPDLLFLDVVMPGCSGLEVLQRITHRPTVVFTTAYDRFAVAAFEARALDYLLKPFGRRRLRSALARIGDTLQSGDGATAVERGRAALEPAKATDWLFVRERGRITPVKVTQVIRFEGSDDFVSIHTAERRLLASLRLNELEQMLPADFVRIHRSHIVNLTMVESFQQDEDSRFTVVMRDGARLAVSRERARWLRERTA